jgi:alpha-tubulin suppressor-like RCC1 family protein
MGKKIYIRLLSFSLFSGCLFLTACASLLSSKPWEPLPVFSSCNKVAASDSHVLVVNDKGELYGWGYNNSGRLGDPSIRQVFKPTRITTISDVKCVATGMSHSVAIKNDGTVWQWGSSRIGGLGYTYHRYVQEQLKVPTLVPEINEPAIGISAAGGHNLVLFEGGGFILGEAMMLDS